MSARQNPTWSCKVGFLGECDLPDGADAPMRRAVAATFEELTGVEPQFNFSGWGTPLDEQELAVVENRLPSEEHRKQWQLAQSAPALLDELVGAANTLSEVANVLRSGGNSAVADGMEFQAEQARVVIAKARRIA